jgi:hypothetical protein
MGKIIKIILGFVVIGLILGAGLYFMSGSKSNTGQPLSSQTGATANAGTAKSPGATSDDFLGLLLNISSIELDDSLFTSKSFQSLRDFSTTLSQDTPTGRPNPFAPVGQDAFVDAGSSYSVTTMDPTLVTGTSATFSAVLPPGIVPTDRWFEWGTTNVAPFTNQTPKVQQNLTNGSYTYKVINLTPNTVYYVRAAARVGSTQFFGTVVPFQTANQ